MTDTTNTEPPLPHPRLRFEVAVNNLGERLDYTASEMRAYGDARAAHAVAQMQGEPVASVSGSNDMEGFVQWASKRVPVGTLLYAAPATAEQPRAREITDAEIVALAEEWYDTGTGKDEVAHRLAMAILRKRQPAAIALANKGG